MKLWLILTAAAISLMLLFSRLTIGLSAPFTPFLGDSDLPGWTLIWSDEFDGSNGSGVDPQKWTLETG